MTERRCTDITAESWCWTCCRKSPAEELIVEKLRQDMLEDSIPEFPDAYRSEVRVQAINWVLPEEYDEEELFS